MQNIAFDLEIISSQELTFTNSDHFFFFFFLLSCIWKALTFAWITSLDSLYGVYWGANHLALCSCTACLHVNSSSPVLLLFFLAPWCVCSFGAEVVWGIFRQTLWDSQGLCVQTANTMNAHVWTRAYFGDWRLSSRPLPTFKSSHCWRKPLKLALEMCVNKVIFLFIRYKKASSLKIFGINVWFYVSHIKHSAFTHTNSIIKNTHIFTPSYISQSAISSSTVLLIPQLRLNMQRKSPCSCNHYGQQSDIWLHWENGVHPFDLQALSFLMFTTVRGLRKPSWPGYNTIVWLKRALKIACIMCHVAFTELQTDNTQSKSNHLALISFIHICYLWRLRSGCLV